ncbi:MAG: discoidin domain-containing protein [Granulosicoccus sp.]
MKLKHFLKRIVKHPVRAGLSLILLNTIASGIHAQEFRQPSVINGFYSVEKHRQLVLSDPNLTIHIYGTGNVHSWMMQQTEEMARGIVSSIRQENQRAKFDNHHIFVITDDDPDVPFATIPGHKNTGNSRYTVVNQTLICASAVDTIRPNHDPVWRGWDTPIHEFGHSIEFALDLLSASDLVFAAKTLQREYFPWRVGSWFNADLRYSGVQPSREAMFPTESLYLSTVFDSQDPWQPTCEGAPDPLERLMAEAPDETPDDTSDPNRISSTNWTLDASHNTVDTANAIDSIDATRWTTRQTQRMGQWFSIDMQENRIVSRIILTTQDDSGGQGDHPIVYEVYASDDPLNPGAMVATGEGDSSGTTEINLNLSEPVRFVKIEQTGSSESNWWSIHQIDLFSVNDEATPGDEQPPVSDRWNDLWGSAALPVGTTGSQTIFSGQFGGVSAEEVRFCFQNTGGPIEVFEAEVLSGNRPLSLELNGVPTGWAGVDKIADGLVAGQTGFTSRASYKHHNGAFQCIDFVIQGGENSITEVLVNHDNAGSWKIDQVYVQYR